MHKGIAGHRRRGFGGAGVIMVLFGADVWFQRIAIFCEYADPMAIFDAEVNKLHSNWLEEIMLFDSVSSDVAILSANQLKKVDVIRDSSNVNFPKRLGEFTRVHTQLEEFGY